jgi:hypothetical protein
MASQRDFKNPLKRLKVKFSALSLCWCRDMKNGNPPNQT